MFVYRNKDMYLQYNENTTHTGTHKLVSWTKNINQASVMLSLPFQLRRDLERLMTLERIPVKVTRTVEIVNG